MCLNKPANMVISIQKSLYHDTVLKGLFLIRL